MAALRFFSEQMPESAEPFGQPPLIRSDSFKPCAECPQMVLRCQPDAPKEAAKRSVAIASHGGGDEELSRLLKSLGRIIAFQKPVAIAMAVTGRHVHCVLLRAAQP